MGGSICGVCMHACTNICMQGTSDTIALSLTTKQYRELLQMGLMSNNSWLEVCAGSKYYDNTSRPTNIITFVVKV